MDIFSNVDKSFVHKVEELKTQLSQRALPPMLMLPATGGANELPPDISYRICAIRETFEETGLLLARTGVKINERYSDV